MSDIDESQLIQAISIADTEQQKELMAQADVVFGGPQ